jgi:transposase
MITVANNTRLFLYGEPVNMRKSFEGLSAAIEKSFPGEIFSGAYFIFLNKRKDYIKVFAWDGDGFAIWSKRLEKGTFLCSESKDFVISRKTFLMLLEGVTPKRIQKRFSL